MRRIGIDCRFASVRAGLGTYTRAIVAGLLERKDETEYVLFVHDDPLSKVWIASLPRQTFSAVTVSCTHYSLREQWEMPAAMRSAGIDLYFAPHFNVPFFTPVPFVATIHDLILHTYASGSWLKRTLYERVFGNAVRKAHSLIAVSKFTAEEIGHVYGPAARQKTAVVTEGVSTGFVKLSPMETTQRLARFGINPGYLLYVGNAKAHKNLRMLVEAHRSARDVPHLVLVTDPSVRDLLVEDDRVTVFSDIDDAGLCTLYNAARCFVTASLYEGFCLPVLEARACGCPVVAFRVSAIPEVAGNHAVLVAPSANALRGAMEHPPAIADPLGVAFQWAKAAQATADILRKALPPKTHG